MSAPIEQHAPKPVAEMSDREIAEETLSLLRMGAGALQALGSGNMSGMIMGILKGRK